MIEIQNVSKTFVSGRTTVEALHDVNISIGDGSIFGIIGLSGAGKSTLVRCINMLERPTSGEVYVDGQNMGDLAPSQLRAARRGITMIFQQFNLLMQKNCLANVCFPMELAGVPKAEARKKAQELLEKEAATRQSGEFVLPDQFGGLSLRWKEKKSDSSVLLLIGIAAAGFLSYALSDYELHKKVENRGREMKIDYPTLVSKFVLFLGAGLSVRNVFRKLGEDYLKQRGEGGEKRYVYEEILLVCHELDSGISEASAYAHFGARCRSRQYTKFCSLLSHNLKKGNAALLTALQEEAESAMDERKNTARQLGEEAGTKLLFPMILMLVITMVMILIPAFSSFSF